MVHADGTIRTDDMALATVFIIHGYNPVMKRGAKGVVWTITKDEVDEFAEEIVHDYIHGAVRVEPRRFARELKAVRIGVYRVMGVGQKPQGQRVERGQSI